MLLRYNVPGPIEWHARFLLWPIDGDGAIAYWHVVLTPDGDMYVEDLGTGNNDLRAGGVVNRPPDRSIPVEVPIANVYDFGAMPTQHEITSMQGEAC